MSVKDVNTEDYVDLLKECIDFIIPKIIERVINNDNLGHDVKYNMVVSAASSLAGTILNMINDEASRDNAVVGLNYALLSNFHSVVKEMEMDSSHGPMHGNEKSH